MPTKCIDQMPPPMVTAAPDSSALRSGPRFGARRRASRSPV